MKEKYKNLLIPAIILFVSTAFIGPIIHETIGNPFQSGLHNFLNPPKANFTIFPSYYPYENDGLDIIKIDVLNSGDVTLSNFIIDYQFFCEMNNSDRTSIKKTVLNENEWDYFEVTSNINTSCKSHPNNIVIEFYEDMDGTCYNKIQNGTSEVCMLCRTGVNISAKEYRTGEVIQKQFEFLYPFHTGPLIFGVEGQPCELYENAENKTRLTYLEGKTLRVNVFDFTVPCILGEMPTDWCMEKGLLEEIEIIEK